MSEHHQSFVFTQNMNWGFLLCPTPPTQGTVNQPHYVRDVRRVRRPVSTLDCILVKDNSLVLAAGLGPKVNSGACLWVLVRLPCWHVLVNKPTLDLFLYILPRDPWDQLWSNRLVNRTVPCELLGNFISAYSRMFRDPKGSHRVVGGNVIQLPWALPYQWGHCCGSPKSFQSCWTIRADTNAFLWPDIHSDFLHTGRDNAYLGL